MIILKGRFLLSSNLSMKLPVTRYYGSKRRIVDDVWQVLQRRHIRFDSFLDVFGGTGIVSYFMARKGKQVFYNDIFEFNAKIAEALMLTSRGTFTEEMALWLLEDHPEIEYQHIIEENFDGLYYRQDENHTIDVATQNIRHLPVEVQASAYYVLFQSCLIKRPFNIFHRANLNLRLNHTTSAFGNYITWEKTFHDLFVNFTKELNDFQQEEPMDVAISHVDALHLEQQADLVYLDPPYIKKGASSPSYQSRYHFLEGLLHYDEIVANIDHNKVNNELKFGRNKDFEIKEHFVENLTRLLEMHQNSTILISYNSNGVPDRDGMMDILRQYKQRVDCVELGNLSYALNRSNGERVEYLFIGR